MYNPNTWYWKVTDNSNQIFSGATLLYVDPNDNTYKSWLSAGNSPTLITGVDLASIASGIAKTRGVQINSAGTPALNGLYATDVEAQRDINAVITYILVNNVFPGNNATMPWVDKNSNAHVFTIAAFKVFATAIADYIAAVGLFGDSGGQYGSIPSQPITIA